MKIFFLNLLMSVSFSNESPTVDYWLILEEVTASTEMVANMSEGSIKVFDIDGNLVKEFASESTQDNEAMELVSQSEFLFEHGGDAYYVLNK